MKQFTIIGNSAAGIAAAESIRKSDKESKVTIISDEADNSYCRCLISYYLAKDINKEKIYYRQETFYKENNIDLILNKKVTSVSPKKNHIILEDKTQLEFDTLLIATGASPKFPETQGMKKRGVFGFRTLKDVEEIDGLLPVTKSACVLGGGLIGLKAAYGLKKRNVDVKVIIKSKQILSQMLDFEAAGLLQKRLEENGIEIILGQDVMEVIGNGDIKAVKLDSGKALACSMIIVGKGVSPNIGLIKDADIKIGEGIISNNFLQTNIGNIYTAGDVCESFDVTLGRTTINALWPVAVEQGRAAGLNMALDNKFNYEGSLGMNSIEFFGLPAISLGIFKPKELQGIEELKIKDEKANVYKKLVLQNNCLIGAVLVGNINHSGLYLRLIKERLNVLSFKDKLLSENFGFPDIMQYISKDISYGAGYLNSQAT